MLLPIIFMFTKLDMLAVSSFIIIFHYIRWYIFYYEKFAILPDKKDLHYYFDVILWMHVFVLSLFILYSMDTKIGLLYVVFHPLYFYSWTCIHILLSVRLEDFNFKKIYEKFT